MKHTTLTKLCRKEALGIVSRSDFPSSVSFLSIKTVFKRLSDSLATLKATNSAEREGEATEVARIKARGAEARRQTQAVRIFDTLYG